MINKTVLQGRLTRDVEMRTTQSGVSVASFTVAWSKKIKETETQLFLDCTAWRGTADLVAKYFTKGKEIIVEGELSTEKWTDKDGKNRSTIKMTVDQVHFCGNKADGIKSETGTGAAAYSAATGTGSASNFEDISNDDDLPF